MKFQTSLSVLAILATSQLIYAQEAQQQDDTVAVQTVDNSNAPVAETAIPDIYWWKSLLNDEELSRYLTEPAQTAAGATDSAAVPSPAVATSAPESAATDVAASATGVDASASISDATAAATSAATDAVSAAATEASSTGASAWSSSSTAGSPAVATNAISQSIAVPKPSGGSIPPATSSNSVNHTSSATQTNIGMSRVLFSVVAVSAALFKIMN